MPDAVPVPGNTCCMNNDFDIVVIGGGHAGAEAAHAAARLGARVALVSMDTSRIGQMSCNPAIGGLAKGQMVREIDALGGLMGLASDATGIQFRMLNRSKGPAVWGPRCQSDKYRYAREVQRILQETSNLTILQGEVAEIVTEPCNVTTEDTANPDLVAASGSMDAHQAMARELHAAGECSPAAPRTAGWEPATTTATPDSTAARQRVVGVRLADGALLHCRAAVITTGTFLRALMHTGPTQTEGGRVGEASARGLSPCLAKLGLEIGRLKTGTPPRLSRASIDFSAFEPQAGDEDPIPFSYLHEYAPIAGSPGNTDGFAHSPRWTPPLPQQHCYITSTNAQIHDLIRANLHRAPMYSGQIHSVGPRYCPSIEDKVVRFAEKTSHHIFLEPESLETDEIYCNGISTSLPADVQEQIIAMVPGLANARILRHGYAVEYDMVWPTEIRSTLQTKKIAGLFLAGQINGTSGYEEAAAQGLMAGINATKIAAGQPASLVLRRDQAYIGVMVDDLVTKPPIEPYRMFTSRAEHRLHLRADNADERLTPIGRELGLIDDDRWSRFVDMRQQVEAGIEWLASARINNAPAIDLLRRGDTTWDDITQQLPQASGLDPAIGRRIEIRIKYAGYIARQDKQIERMASMEDKLIPENLSYAAVTGLRNEARQTFTRHTPRSLGQALRLAGITPADVTVLAIHLTRPGSARQSPSNR